jgi:hypothetical protein
VRAAVRAHNARHALERVCVTDGSATELENDGRTHDGEWC